MDVDKPTVSSQLQILKKCIWVGLLLCVRVVAEIRLWSRAWLIALIKFASVHRTGHVLICVKIICPAMWYGFVCRVVSE